MHDNEPKPGIVIDVSPEPVATGSERPPQDPTPHRGAAAGVLTGRLALALALVALTGVAILGWMAYQQGQQLLARAAATDASLARAASERDQLHAAVQASSAALRGQDATLNEQRELLAMQRKAFDEARGRFEQQERLLASENLRLQEREAELRAVVADVHRRVGRSGTQWMTAEAEYLIRVANDRLILARDTLTARMALELADQRLRDTKDPGWAGVRAQLARDIAGLDAFEAPDTSGLAARLAALIEQIPQLRLTRATMGAERTLPVQAARDPGERSWDTLLDDLWSGFRNSVRIRERDQPVQAMLPPEQQYFLYENLKLQLQAARLGVARDDPRLYLDNLRLANDWLKRYFEPDHQVTMTLATALAEMQRLEIRPPMPDISQSLRSLQSRIKLADGLVPGEVESQ